MIEGGYNSKLRENKANSTNLYPPTNYFRETCKSQNINPIYLTLSSDHNKHLQSMF